LFRSSYSGGWHLYLFFEEPINSADLRRQLLKLLKLNDFQVGKGQLEIFPHPGGEGSLGLGLRLPMQPGFAWLDKRDLEVDHERHEIDATQALELFIDALDGDANTYAAFRQLKSYIEELEKRKSAAIARGRGEQPASNVVPIRRTEREVQDGEFIDFVQAVFHRLPPGIIVDNWYNGRLYHLNGLTGPSQRAESIECVGHYLFYGDPSRNLPALGYGYEQEREWALEEFLRARHHGQSQEINRGRADAFAQVERAANWRPAHKKAEEPQKYSPVVSITWVKGNAKRQTDARKRISTAFDELNGQDRSFTTEELRKAAGCSRDTLYKHEDIWRAEYDRRKAIAQNQYTDLAEGFFAICTGEYNGVVGAASSESKPPTTSLEPDMPPGRLAARRIVYEISMRSDRDKRQAQKSAVSSQEASESTWEGEVTRLTEKEPSTLSVAEIKLLLAILLAYLATAPSYESQEHLQAYISGLRQQLATETTGPLNMVRPP
jgi:hypothetical protein